MFGLIKFIIAVVRAAWRSLDPNVNPLRHAPPEFKYLASILLGCFWSLAFGLWAGELMFIGYNMLGHVAVITMAFVTWRVMRYSEKKYAPRGAGEILRDPARAPKCYDMTDQEREQAIAIQNQTAIKL